MQTNETRKCPKSLSCIPLAMLRPLLRTPGLGSRRQLFFSLTQPLSSNGQMILPSARTAGKLGPDWLISPHILGTLAAALHARFLQRQRQFPRLPHASSSSGVAAALNMEHFHNATTQRNQQRSYCYPPTSCSYLGFNQRRQEEFIRRGHASCDVFRVLS